MTKPHNRSTDATADMSPPTASNVTSVIFLRIRLLQWRKFPATPENDYQAAVIQDAGRYLYRAKGITVPITEDEAQQVVRNPFTYYFSTALKLELRIDRARKGLTVDGETA